MNNKASHSNTTRMQHQEKLPIYSFRLQLAKAIRAAFGKEFFWPMLILFALCPNLYVVEAGTSWLPYYRIFGALVLCLGTLFRYWAHTYEKEDSFVLDGPYRYVRNPVEMGTICLFLGSSMLMKFHPIYAAFVCLIAFIYFNFVSIVYETEIFLALGTMYLRYKNRVKRWIPSWLPGINKSQENLKLLRGLRHALSSLCFFTGIFVVIALRNRFDLGAIGNQISDYLGLQ